jgi:DNA-binding NarL/FixJ family response regulator
MPVLDGFAVMRKIRENPRFGSLPVVAVTAYAMPDDREKILNSKFDGYLSKPTIAAPGAAGIAVSSCFPSETRDLVACSNRSIQCSVRK